MHCSAINELQSSLASANLNSDRGGVESARADFNFQELPCYLGITYEILPLLLKSIGKQDSVKTFC